MVYTTIDRSGDVSDGNSQQETRNVQHPIVRKLSTNRSASCGHLCRNYQEDKRTEGRMKVEDSDRKRIGKGNQKGSQSWRKVAELISGTSGKRSFQRIMRADPGELAFRKMLIASSALTLLFPSYQFSIRLSLSTVLSFPSPPRYQSSTSSVAEMYNPPFAYACVGYRSPWFLLSLRSLSDPYLAVPTASYGSPQKSDARTHSSVLLFDNSFHFVQGKEKYDYPQAKEWRIERILSFVILKLNQRRETSVR